MGKKNKKPTSGKSKVSLVKRQNIKSNKRGGHAGQQLGVKHGRVMKKVGKKPAASSGALSKSVGKWTGARYGFEAAKKAGFVHGSKKGANGEEEEEPEEKDEILPSDEEEEADAGEDFEDEDLDYIKRRGAKFLSGVEESEPQDAPKSRKNKHKENVPAPFELEPRQLDTDPRLKMKALLPIKHSEGLEYRWEEKRKFQDEDDDAEKIDDKPTRESLPTLTTEELLAHRKEKLTKKKQRIATLASAVQMDPDKNIFKMKELIAMLRENDPELRVTLRKLTMVTLCELFKDIAPGYRIREEEDSEKDIQYKKEVKARRTYEMFLLRQYRRYLEFLEQTINEIRKTKNQEKRDRLKEEETASSSLEIPREAKNALAEIATKCMCSLLNNLFHFNYRTNIISVVASLMINKNEMVSDQCCQCIKQLFREDLYGEAAVDAVRFITRLAKAKHYNIAPKVLDTFLSLKIKETNLNNPDLQKRKELEEKKDKMRRLSRSQRRFQKRMDRLDKELQATEASENKKRKLKMHTEIIQAVFATYFRILKMESGSRLLSSVLEGLARFAHLINVEFFDDLVKSLHHLIDSETLGHRESLHCVLTAFQILSGQGDVLNIDPTKFYTHFYVTLLHVNAGASSDDVSVILECLEAMINKRHKQVSIQRVLAYLKRLCTLSLQSLPSGSLGYLCTIRNLMKRHPKSDALLDTESSGSGVFMPELAQPEHCHAHNTSLWELQILKRHYHQVIQTYANHLCRGFPYTGAGALDVDMARKTPQHFLEEYDTTSMQFNPPLPPKTSQISKKKAKLQLHSVVDGQFIQDEFQKMVSSTMEKDTETWTDINFAELAQKSRENEEDEDSVVPESELEKNDPDQAPIGTPKAPVSVIKIGTKRKEMSVSKSKIKKFKGAQKGILRTNGKC